jgi:hypothetical protein
VEILLLHKLQLLTVDGYDGRQPVGAWVFVTQLVHVIEQLHSAVCDLNVEDARRRLLLLLLLLLLIGL